MRLLVVTQYFWPENFLINDLVKELVKRGYLITVLTGLPNYPSGKVFTEYKSDPSQYAHYEGAKVIRVNMMARGKTRISLILNYLTFALSATLNGLWKLRGHRFDAIFIFEPSPITVALPAIVARYIKCAPTIIWVQDLWPESIKAVGAIKSPSILWAVGILVRFIYKRSDLILSQSKSFIPQILKYAPLDSRIAYFPNWSFPTANKNVPTEVNGVPVKNGNFNVMFAGNIGIAQDFPSILAAAERLKKYSKIRWLILGDGSMATWVSAEIRRRNLHEQVLMLGRHHPDRIPSFFKHASALLVTLKDEPIFSMTIPSKLQTYLASGTPVLCMMNGEGSDIVRESGAGFTCRAGDYKAFAEAVLKMYLLTDDERYEMGCRALVFSQREFNKDKLITHLTNLINELVTSSVSPNNSLH